MSIYEPKSINHESTTFSPADPEQLSLGAGEVHLWRANLTGPLPGEEVLEASELSRIGRLIDPQKRAWRLNCRRILRRLLGAYLDLPPAELSLWIGPHGRPHLNKRVHRSDLNFNLSHAGSLAVIALARTHRLGVDIEPIRPLRRRRALLDRCFSPAERGRLQTHPHDQRERLFFRAWTAKEAVLKAEGSGIFHDPAVIEVVWSPGAQVRGDGGRGQLDRWWRWEFVPAAGVCGTVALPAGDWTVRCLDATAPGPPNTEQDR